jgi:molybdopterin molybdotransferase
VLAELGKVDFWKINLRPGKPLAFGELHDAQGRAVPFFGLPGNPVSAMVTFDVLVRPALLKMQGRADDAVVLPVIVGENMNSDGRRSYLRVKLTRDEQGRLTAHSTGTQSSGALTSMIAADGLLIVPEDVTRIEAGTTLTARLLRQM